jgi:hypothetical protein
MLLIQSGLSSRHCLASVRNKRLYCCLFKTFAFRCKCSTVYTGDHDNDDDDDDDGDDTLEIARFLDFVNCLVF